MGMGPSSPQKNPLVAQSRMGWSTQHLLPAFPCSSPTQTKHMLHPAGRSGALLCKAALGSHCPVGDSSAEGAQEDSREAKRPEPRSQQEGIPAPDPEPFLSSHNPSPPSPPLAGTLAPMSPQGSQSCTLLLCSKSLTSAFFPFPKGTQDTKFFPLCPLFSPSPLPLIPSTQLCSRGFSFLPTPLPFYYYYFFLI